MTAVEWFVEKTFTDFGKSVKSNEIKMALEMEKQQIIDAHISGYDSSGGSAEDYYKHYYGSKGCDELSKVAENTSFAKGSEKQYISQTNTSQTEISDEEIEKESDHYKEANGSYSFKMAIKWYREQLKNKQ